MNMHEQDGVADLDHAERGRIRLREYTAAAYSWEWTGFWGLPSPAGAGPRPNNTSGTDDSGMKA